jgi:hypothetical protein
MQHKKKLMQQKKYLYNNKNYTTTTTTETRATATKLVGTLTTVVSLRSRSRGVVGMQHQKKTNTTKKILVQQQNDATAPK